MKDLSCYFALYESDDCGIYFLKENGSCSVVKRKYEDYGIVTCEEAIVAVKDLKQLTNYPSSESSLTIEMRMQFLFGTSDGFFRFIEICQSNNIDIRIIKW